MKEKKSKKSIVLVVFLLLFAVSIGYAVLSGTFNFIGSISIKGNQWEITPPTEEEIEEEPKDPENPPVIETDDKGNVTIRYKATLEKPGDTYTLTVPVKNDGSIDAFIADVKTTVNQKSAEAEKYLTYSIVAVDNAGNESQLKGKDLLSNSQVKVKITVKYKDDDVKNLPENDITGIEFSTVLQLEQKTN